MSFSVAYLWTSIVTLMANSFLCSQGDYVTQNDFCTLYFCVFVYPHLDDKRCSQHQIILVYFTSSFLEVFGWSKLHSLLFIMMFLSYNLKFKGDKITSHQKVGHPPPAVTQVGLLILTSYKHLSQLSRRKVAIQF